ncbi:hypothetical protein G6011_04689 [Alternaria panax]|uniref:Uncharacterized protein n=1 Tax=Alternaria panax TaxID=48097 RepID=A0AAD4IHK2_9PLEO|nr:hypothetical protein G6011_04689 [Alternaria panax]
MAFKGFIARLKQNLLCDKHERKPNLDIGEPTNVRVIDVSESLPGLTDAQRKQIREEASSGALRLQDIRSQPPTSPPSPNDFDAHRTSVATDTAESVSTHTEIISLYSFSDVSPEESAMAMVARNTTFENLPSSVSTSPRRKQRAYSPLPMRVKSMWNSKGRYSSDSNGKENISHSSSINETSLKDKRLDADSSHVLKIEESDYVQDNVHGVKETKEEISTVVENAAVRQFEGDIEVERD